MTVDTDHSFHGITPSPLSGKLHLYAGILQPNLELVPRLPSREGAISLVTGVEFRKTVCICERSQRPRH